jgi:PDZ domain-containing secreted protein
MPQVGLNNLAIFTKRVHAPNILTSSCCFLEGIVTYEGIIQKEYLKRFIESKQSDYGDIGIRLIQKKDYIVVSASNPYIKENKFKNGDIILKYNEKKIINAAMLMRKILFSKIGSTHTFELKRNNKILKFKIKSFKRYGGGLISDTFLEQKGIFFDKNLTIIQINNKLESNGLEVGDKLLQINHTKVQTQKELRIYISNFTDFSSLLVSRDGFEFFVNLK